MKKSIFSTLIIGFLVGNTWAQEACLLETNATMMGIKLDVKDCIQNSGMNSDDFKAQCEGLSNAAVAMGGPAAKITYLSSCPVPFQAKCDNSPVSKTVYFYYKRAAEEEAGLKASCEMLSGVYTKGAL